MSNAVTDKEKYEIERTLLQNRFDHRKIESWEYDDSILALKDKYGI